MDTIQEVLIDREIVLANHDDLKQLSELQLALVGGGIADVVYG